MVAHVEGAYREICERAAGNLGIEIIYTGTGNLVSMEALSNLRNTIESICTSESLSKKSLNVEEEKKNFLVAIADISSEKMPYFFSLRRTESFGQRPVPQIRSSLPGKQLATLVPQYGMLALSLGELN